MGTATEIGGVGGQQCRLSDTSPSDSRNRSHRHGSTRTFLILVDLCIIWASSLLCVHFRFGDWQNPSKLAEVLVSKHFFFLGLFSVLFVLIADRRNLYATRWVRTLPFDFAEPMKAIGAAALLVIFSVYFSGIKVISREVIGGSILLSAFALIAWRYWWRSQAIEGLTEHRNVAIVGAGRVGVALRDYLNSNPGLGYVFKGFIDRRAKARQRHDYLDDIEIIGEVDELHAIARSYFVDEILITDAGNRELVKNIAVRARALEIDVRVVPDLYDGLALGAGIELIGNFPTMALYLQPVSPLKYMLKRVIDVLLSAFGLVLLAPAICMVAIAIKLDSAGSIIYSSDRIGKKGQTFRCHKFRTMVTNADELKESLRHLNERDGVLFKISEDPRVTRIGRFLRAWSIDELPQLWNVLKGDMSLVGPRPGLPSEFDQYSLDHLRRLEVLPGITGMWQVEARRNPSFDQYITLDLQYVENWSIWLDVRLLWKTIGAVLAGTGS